MYEQKQFISIIQILHNIILRVLYFQWSNYSGVKRQRIQSNILHLYFDKMKLHVLTAAHLTIQHNAQLHKWHI